MMRVGLVASIMAIACGPSPSSTDGGDGDAAGIGDPCEGTQARCVGQSQQECNGGEYVEVESCQAGDVCAPDLGCVQCDPSNGQVCVGDNVHTCNSDGTVGGQIEECGFESCFGGACGTEDGCSAEAELIYLVDDSNTLYSFDPALLPADPFRVVGNLACPAGSAFPEFDPLGGTATPFSMSVDRGARAWVLYSSGQIFEVDTSTAACSTSTFQVSQQGFSLFGMGFVSDAPGSADETLFIAGGPLPLSGASDLGTITMGPMTVRRIGAVATAENNPELTGTGDAELFGYFPGASSMVVKIDKTSGGTLQTWSLPGLSGQVRAWAFAHWGGKFYIFITTTIGIDTIENVLELDPVTGTTTTVLENTNRIIVGAGVSTCAPVVVN